MKKSICKSMILVGFLLVCGASGGMEQGNASLVDGMIIAAVGCIAMFSGYVGSKGGENNG